MRLRYGFNKADSRRDFALRLRCEQIWAWFRDTDSRIIGIFLFDRYTPDPATEWPMLARSVQAVLNVGATP